MKMIKLLSMSVLVAAVAAPALAAPAWDEMERRCVSALEAKCTEIHGANCLGWWPSAVRCTITNIEWSRAPDPQHIEQCIAHVKSQRETQHLCAMCGTDPIAAAIRCVTGE